jgi:tetratricopeptide (TPR) repeat protein
MRISSLAFALCVAASPALADNVAALVHQSRAAESHGHLDSAIMLMQSAMVADPARVETYVALGDLYRRAHEDAFAQHFYDEALTLDPQADGASRGLSLVGRTANATDKPLDKE